MKIPTVILFWLALTSTSVDGLEVSEQKLNREQIPYFVIGGPAAAKTYRFGYDTKITSGAPRLMREETRLPDGTVIGRYGYTDPFGVFRIVQYVAGLNGYYATEDIGGASLSTPQFYKATARQLDERNVESEPKSLSQQLATKFNPPLYHPEAHLAESPPTISKRRLEIDDTSDVEDVRYSSTNTRDMLTTRKPEFRYHFSMGVRPNIEALLAAATSPSLLSTTETPIHYTHERPVERRFGDFRSHTSQSVNHQRNTPELYDRIDFEEDDRSEHLVKESQMESLRMNVDKHLTQTNATVQTNRTKNTFSEDLHTISSVADSVTNAANYPKYSVELNYGYKIGHKYSDEDRSLIAQTTTTGAPQETETTTTDTYSTDYDIPESVKHLYFDPTLTTTPPSTPISAETTPLKSTSTETTTTLEPELESQKIVAVKSSSVINGDNNIQNKNGSLFLTNNENKFVNNFWQKKREIFVWPSVVIVNNKTETNSNNSIKSQIFGDRYDLTVNTELSTESAEYLNESTTESTTEEGTTKIPILHNIEDKAIELLAEKEWNHTLADNNRTITENPIILITSDTEIEINQTNWVSVSPTTTTVANDTSETLFSNEKSFTTDGYIVRENKSRTEGGTALTFDDSVFEEKDAFALIFENRKRERIADRIIDYISTQTESSLTYSDFIAANDSTSDDNVWTEMTSSSMPNMESITRTGFEDNENSTVVQLLNNETFSEHLNGEGVQLGSDLTPERDIKDETYSHNNDTQTTDYYSHINTNSDDNTDSSDRNNSQLTSTTVQAFNEETNEALTTALPTVTTIKQTETQTDSKQYIPPLTMFLAIPHSTRKRVRKVQKIRVKSSGHSLSNSDDISYQLTNDLDKITAYVTTETVTTPTPPSTPPSTLPSTLPTTTDREILLSVGDEKVEFISNEDSISPDLRPIYVRHRAISSYYVPPFPALSLAFEGESADPVETRENPIIAKTKDNFVAKRAENFPISVADLKHEYSHTFKLESNNRQTIPNYSLESANQLNASPNHTTRASLNINKESQNQLTSVAVLDNKSAERRHRHSTYLLPLEPSEHSSAGPQPTNSGVRL